jgi:hypothetical protein
MPKAILERSYIGVSWQQRCCSDSAVERTPFARRYISVLLITLLYFEKLSDLKNNCKYRVILEEETKTKLGAKLYSTKTQQSFCVIL